MRQVVASLSALAALTAPAAARGVVISEIHYHPPAGLEDLEFVEVTGDSTSPEDISGYRFTEGIEYEFPPGTVLSPGGILVVCANPDAVRSSYGLPNPLGPFAGKLDSSGERITLANHAAVAVVSLSYRDEGKWPTGPDGTGHTLVSKGIHLDPAEPESWAQSPEIGGSPGRPNFPTGEPQFKEEVVLEAGEAWRYAKGTGPFSEPETAWRDPAFDDSGWLEGPSGFGFGDPNLRTVLDDMLNIYTAIAVRKRFQVAPELLEGNPSFFLGVDFDDGFCAYLNGRELARANCGAAGSDPAWNATASLRREAGKEAIYEVPREAVSAGANVLAILGLNYRINDTDFSLVPRLLRRVPIVEETASRPPVVFNELYRGAARGSGWVEIHNAGDAAADLAGFAVADDPARPDPYRFPEGTAVVPRGFLVVEEAASGLDLSSEEVRLFLLAPDGYCVAATAFDRTAPEGWTQGFSEACFPDGNRQAWVTPTPTRGAPNAVERVTDVVINEIFYHPPDDRSGEFIEIHNRGQRAIDLSGFRFDRGIDYTFGPGTTIEAGGYLVVTEDPALLLETHGQKALGPFEGRLADAGENVRLVDSSGNVASEVRYHDGGSWPRWADGGGSSIELIDPRHDGAFATAWEASFEEDKAPWELYSFHVENYTPAAASELHLFLAERGVCRVDDVSITRDGGENHIQNPGFETDAKLWVIQGTHVRSRRVEGDAHTGAACLEVNASGKGDTLVNRIEADTKPSMTRGPYDVSLWARWLRGGSLLLVHGEYTAGSYGGRPSPAINLSGNSMSAALKLKVPQNLGTPGAENSARRRLREATGGGNLGPVIGDVRHSPAVPAPNISAPVTARASDPDGVASVKAYWRLGGAGDEMAAVDLLDDGAHGDGAAGDGVYGGAVPGQVARSKVVYYVEAADGAGAARRFPVDAPARTLLYMVLDPTSERLDTARVVLDNARSQELQSRPLHSNDLVDAAFVFDDAEVYYSVGVRYRGSPWGRPSRSSFRVRFEDDRRFHRGRRAVNMSSRGGAPNEGSAYFLIGRMGVPEKPVPYPEYSYVRYSFNGGTFATYGMIQPVDRDLLVKWYGDGVEGPSLKVEGRRQFNDAMDLAGMWDGGSFTYRKDEKENYRGYFIPSVRQSIDNWDPFMALSKVMDRKTTPDLAFDQEIEKHLDVEEFLRDLSGRILTSDWDAFCVGNGHNGYLVLDHRDRRWDLLPFDVDNTFSNSSTALFPTADPDVARLMTRPWARRIYFRILSEILDDYWSPVTARPYLDAVQAVMGVGTTGIKTYLSANVNVVKNGLRTVSTATFRIVTNGGEPVWVAPGGGGSVELEGEAPVKVAAIAYQRNKGPLEVLAPAWTSPVRWKASFALDGPETVFDFAGLDRLGEPIGSASTAVRIGVPPPTFVRGDADATRTLSITDAIRVLRYLFGGEALACLDAGDADDNGSLNLTDAIALLEYLFRQGAPPPAPFPEAGPDPTEDELDCEG
ncbi:MAG: lamin tail domain-containing protein [Planctomycetes bacterium]|nr:lamin tail domain-containing protein [Planctomycetota bacterium]